MPNDNPTPGRCNAKRGDGKFCANKPAIPEGFEGSNGRCKWHGGFAALRKNDTNVIVQDHSSATQTARRENHGLYSRYLRNTLRTAAEQAVFDDPETKKLDLTPEINLWRSKILGWQRNLNEGTTMLETNSDTFVSLESIIARGQVILDKLISTQAKLHPGALEHSGELRINIHVSGEARTAAAKLEMPDLEASQARSEASTNPLAPASESDVVEEDSPLSLLGDDP